MHAFLRDHPLCQNHARQRPGPTAFGTYLTGAERQKPVGGLQSFAASAFVVLPTPPSQRDSDNDADRSPLARDKSLEHLGHSTDPEGAQCFTPGRTPCSQTACSCLPFYTVAGENERDENVRDFISINLLLTLKHVTRLYSEPYLQGHVFQQLWKTKSKRSLLLLFHLQQATNNDASIFFFAKEKSFLNFLHYSTLQCSHYCH